MSKIVYRTISPDGLIDAIEKHRLYLSGSPDGKRLNLRGHDLRVHEFSGLDLTEAIFSEAVLFGVSFRGAKLCRGVFAWADMRNADLRGADLLGAHLAYADMRGVKTEETRSKF